MSATITFESDVLKSYEVMTPFHKVAQFLSLSLLITTFDELLNLLKLFVLLPTISFPDLEGKFDWLKGWEGMLHSGKQEFSSRRKLNP